MKDRNGKTIKVGNFVRTPEGISQVGMLVSTTNSFHSSEVEVISAKDASASKGADGDSIIWGS